MSQTFAKIETNETRYVGRMDAATLQEKLTAVVADFVGIPDHTPGLGLVWGLGGTPEAPELTFDLVRDHAWFRKRDED